jgi:hypothetical protein|tara:strand:- start:523 stop:975 length:453 start_codon:yes stop_codon:yes gene_type:complete
MNQIFDLNETRRQQVIVEYLNPTGSGFAVTPKGEQVFLNARLVTAMNVQPGNVYNAFLLPNYPDKRDQIPWRAMRVEPVHVDLDLAHVADDDLEKEIVMYIKSNGMDFPYTPSMIAADLDREESEVIAAMERNKDRFYKVDAYMLFFGNQ